MGILFTGKHNLRAWEYALFEGKNNYFVLPDVKLYERLTEQQISNDCRIILDSVEICQTTKNHETFVSRKKMAKERYTHLKTLIPFASGKQRRLIKEASKAIKLL
jgi:hypothetical protein